MHPKAIDISIVTPSYNMKGYLERCHASIMDQNGIACEHIVIDGGSTDGTVEWLKDNDKVSSISEKDNGMYDAINKGFKRAKGNILAYLNCDEQYLPGTLEFVKEYFYAHPAVDMIFGHMLLIRPNGVLISFRKAYQPRSFYIKSSFLYVGSCTMFFRRRIIDNGISLNAKLRTVGDTDFVLKVLKNGYCTTYVNRYLSAFTITGNNMMTGENARREREEACKRSSFTFRLLKYPLNALRLGEKMLSRAYFQKMPIDYAIFADDLQRRKYFSDSAASFRWPK